MTLDTHPSATHRAVGLWLAGWAVMVFLTVIIGGATRLTESGLSITEWKPVSGVVPPLNEAQWQVEFEKYQRIPEYQQVNRGMSLGQFKAIFLWEYVHRLWARLVGLAFAVPFALFLARGRLERPLAGRLWLILALTGAQAAMGWFMVQSGLTERTDVSQYRLAAHLGLALVIYVLTVWTAADLLRPAPNATVEHVGGVRRGALALLALTFLTAIAGAFVAGLDAGKAYNTFPLMGGKVVPDGYLLLHPWWRNLFENVATVQFNHRLLGVTTLLLALGLRVRAGEARIPVAARGFAGIAALVAVGQAVLGVSTLLFAVPIPIAVLHQGGAVLLLTAGTLLVHALRAVPAAVPFSARALAAA
jgi:cytochrome c oxidase assembly protein subunit 15